MEKTDIELFELARFFSGQVSQEEREAIEKWIHLSEENKLVAQNVYQLLYASDALQTIQEIDPQEALGKLKRRVRRRNLISKTKKIAYPIVPLLFFLFMYVFAKHSNSLQCLGTPIETHTTSGMISLVELPDGSKVWLNSSSYIKYPNHFSDDKREVYVTGEAYFAVAKNEKSKFIVHTIGDVSIEVTGTEFNIDAYETSSKVTTTLVEGAITLAYKDREKQLKKIALSPDQQIAYNTRTFQMAIQSTFVPKDIAWKNGSVIFRDTPFHEALWILSKRFNVNFSVKKESLWDYSFTGTFTDQNLIRILEYFKLSSGIDYSQKQVVGANGEILQTEIELY